MTARELIKAIQNLGEEHLDKEVWHYDEYHYIPTEAITITSDEHYDCFVGRWIEKEIIGLS